MPVYTYRCRNCGVEFKKTQSFFDQPVRRCPACRATTLRRVPQLPSVVFKGAGWYSTDHRASSGQTSAVSDKNRKAESTSGE